MGLGFWVVASLGNWLVGWLYLHPVLISASLLFSFLFSSFSLIEMAGWRNRILHGWLSGGEEGKGERGLSDGLGGKKRVKAGLLGLRLGYGRRFWGWVFFLFWSGWVWLGS